MPGSVLAIIIVAIIFGSVTAWLSLILEHQRKRVKATELRALEQRVAQLETELAEQRRLLTDAILEQEDPQWRQLDAEAGQRIAVRR